MGPIDTLDRVETPDGIELSLRPAGPVLRAVAWLIDLSLRGGIMIALGILLGLLEVIGMALFVLLWFLINWWYPVLFEVYGRGATPGKKAVALRVINQDGTPIGWGPSIIRNLLRQVDFLPLLYATGLVSMFCNRRFQRLGDLAAATLVVYADEPRGEAAGTGAEAESGQALALRLSADEQRAVLSFAERCPNLHPDRAAELAELLSPLTGLHGADNVERVLAWARAIEGRDGVGEA
jgi:uncharacterized RDD family membrane protein YckC